METLSHPTKVKIASKLSKTYWKVKKRLARMLYRQTNKRLHPPLG